MFLSLPSLLLQPLLGHVPQGSLCGPMRQAGSSCCPSHPSGVGSWGQGLGRLAHLRVGPPPQWGEEPMTRAAPVPGPAECLLDVLSPGALGIGIPPPSFQGTIQTALGSKPKKPKGLGTEASDATDGPQRTSPSQKQAPSPRPRPQKRADPHPPCKCQNQDAWGPGGGGRGGWESPRDPECLRKSWDRAPSRFTHQARLGPPPTRHQDGLVKEPSLPGRPSVTRRPQPGWAGTLSAQACHHWNRGFLLLWAFQRRVILPHRPKTPGRCPAGDRGICVSCWVNVTAQPRRESGTAVHKTRSCVNEVSFSKAASVWVRAESPPPARVTVLRFKMKL